jgi:hypothetical protein
MFIQEHNCETGEITQRNLTAKEVKDRQNEYDAQIAIAEAKKTAKAAILDRIGLTADELKTILG